MSLPLVLLVALSAAPDVEYSAEMRVIEQFERRGMINPISDPTLRKAAAELADYALYSSAVGAADISRLTEAVSQAGGSDASPRAFVLKGSTLRELHDALARRRDVADEKATHVGAAVATSERLESAVMVVLLADRKAEILPFARHFDRPGAKPSFCAILLPAFRSPEVFVTRPNGRVDRWVPTSRKERVCATIPFTTLGRHTVELLVRGERGPEVAALFFVDVGEKAAPMQRVVEQEPDSIDEIREKVRERINRLRRAHALEDVNGDKRLDAIAQAYAEKMADQHFFAHVAPDGSDVRQRLISADYAYVMAGENLGLASGPLTAHFGIEHSPGHRRTLMDKDYTFAGIGSAKRADGMWVLVEVLVLRDPDSNANPLEQAYSAINRARKAQGLPPLKRATELEPLLTQHAIKALHENRPKANLEGERLHDRVFSMREDLKTVSIDFFVADRPSLVTDSKNLREPSANLVGIGLTQGDSPTLGPKKFWVVVVYGSTQ